MRALTRYKQLDVVGMLLKEVRDSLGTEVFSAEIECAIEKKVRLHWGGQEVYVKLARPDPDARALAIRAEYNMKNRRELQEKYDIGRAMFYKILRGG
jgi:Mor family transcriptional regulator